MIGHGSAAARLAALAVSGAHSDRGLGGEPRGSSCDRSQSGEQPFDLPSFYAKFVDKVPPSDNEVVVAAFLELGYDMMTNSYEQILQDIRTLGPSTWLKGLPTSLGLRGLCAVHRFVKLLDVEEAPSLKEALPSTSEASTGVMQSMLKVLGVSDPHAEEQERLKHKATAGDLARRLNLGVFAPTLLQDKPLLDKATLVAQLGHFLQPEAEPSEVKSERFFVKALDDLLRSGVAGLLQHRITPAALLSELHVALGIALDDKLKPPDAQRAAIAYTHRVRKLLYDASLNVPLKPQAAPHQFQQAMEVFLKRDPSLYMEAKEGLTISSPAARQAPAGIAVKSESNEPKACLRYAVSGTLCGSTDAKPCGFSHKCPFCNGSKCQHTAGYLHTHLANLRAPLVLKPKSEWDNLLKSGGAAGSGRKPPLDTGRGAKRRQDSRPRSRSPRRVERVRQNAQR